MLFWRINYSFKERNVEIPFIDTVSIKLGWVISSFGFFQWVLSRFGGYSFESAIVPLKNCIMCQEAHIGYCAAQK